MGKHARCKSNREVVESLYTSLACGDAAAVTMLLAADVDWWFHGPRRCQHMGRLLTGESTGATAFQFVAPQFAPTRIVEVGGAARDGMWVVAERYSKEHDYWVHAWCLHAGVITSFREYFNTSVTVRELSLPAKEDRMWAAVAEAGLDVKGEPNLLIFS